MFALTHLRPALFVIAAVVVAYGPSLRNGFVFDDAMFVRDDARVHTLGEAPRLFVEPLWGYLDEDGVRRVHQYYRPLQTFPLALLRAGFGERAWPAHLLNVTLHAVNALLVYSIFAMLLGSVALGLALSLLWAVHPAYSEAVLWVSNLAGLGAAMAILGVLRLHMAAVTGWARCAGIGLLLFAGLLFHEIAVVALPLALAFESIAAKPRRWRRLGSELLACVPALSVYAWLRLGALGGVVPGLGKNPMTLPELALNGIALLPKYVAAFVWPFDLNMYHDFDPVSGLADPASIAGIVIVLLAGGGFAFSVRRKPLVAFAMAWMGITTLPYLVIRWPQLNVFAERYLYLPAIGLFLFLGAVGAGLVPARRLVGQHGTREAPGAGRLQGSPLRAFVIVVILLVAVGIATIWRRTPDWRDDVTLYSKTLNQSKRAVLVRNNLAVRLLEQRRYDEGIHVLEVIAQTSAATSDTLHNLGLLRAGAGDDRGAVRAFRRASRYGVPRLPTLLNLGYMYDRIGERRSAVETYMRLVDRAPDYAPAWFNLAMIAVETGQHDNARFAVARVLEATPDDPQARALQQRLQRSAVGEGDPPPAEHEATRRHCRQAMRQARRGRYREALIQLRAAAWLDERAALPHQFIANVAALRGDWELALAESRAALERAPGNPLYRRNVEALEKKLAEVRQ